MKGLIIIFVAFFASSALGRSYPVEDDTISGSRLLIDAMKKSGVSSRMLESNIISLIDGIIATIPEYVDYSYVNISALGNNIQVLGTVENVTTRGFPDHVLDQVKFSILPIGFGMHLAFADIGASGTYDLDGLFAQILPLYGDGQFDIGLSEVSFSLKVDIASKGDVLSVKNLEVEFAVGGCTFKANHFLGGDLGLVWGEILEENLPDYVARIMYYYGDTLEDTITTGVNKFLEGKTVNDLIDWISNRPTPAPETLNFLFGN